MRHQLETQIVGDCHAIELAGMIVVFVNQNIFRLSCANFVIVNLLIFILCRHLFAFGRRWIPVIIEAFVAAP